MPLTLSTSYLETKNAQLSKPVDLLAIEDYDSLRKSSAATSTLANHLVDIAGTFTNADIGKTIHNTTDDKYAIITAINSGTDVTLSKDIMVNGETYDLDNNLYFAAYKTDIVFDTITYTSFPFTIGEVTENIQGEVDVFKVRLANVSRVIQFYVENYDLREKKVTIRQVWSDKLSDTTNLLQYSFYIDKYVVGTKVAEFECSSKFDIVEVEIPTCRYLRGCCRWKTFKGTQCGYAGAETTCNRTLDDCRARGNTKRFGGFPSIPTQRTFIS